MGGGASSGKFIDLFGFDGRTVCWCFPPVAGSGCVIHPIIKMLGGRRRSRSQQSWCVVRNVKDTDEEFFHDQVLIISSTKISMTFVSGLF